MKPLSQLIAMRVLILNYGTGGQNEREIMKFAVE